MTKKDMITKRAAEFLIEIPNGLRWSELYRKLVEEFSSGEHKIPSGTITGTLQQLEKISKGSIYKPDKGVFRHIKFKGDFPIVEPVLLIITRIREEDFYRPFADWIVNDLEECTKAIPLGGNKFGDKWGTPDVIGIRAPRLSYIFKPPTEIISAEIKIDKYSDRNRLNYGPPWAKSKLLSLLKRNASHWRKAIAQVQAMPFAFDVR